MATFGQTGPKIIPLDLSGNQFEIYNKFSKNYSHSFLFESLTGPEELAETSIMGFEPSLIVKGYANKIILQYRDGRKESQETIDPLTFLRSLIKKNSDLTYRYLGGAVGIIHYDAVRLWENISESNYEQPLMEFGIFEDGILYDNKKNKSFYFYYDKNRLDELKISESDFGDFEISDVKVDLNETKFKEIVKKAKKYIHDGDIFQVVLSRRFNFTASGDHLKVYKILRQLNPSPYLFHIKMGDRIIVGASPEMLIRVSGDVVETFPIAGTRKITKNNSENARLKQEMLTDEKEIAEHTMLVDLGRNDIGRVCKHGSVKVKELMQVKRFSHVQHMVTHVVGELDKKFDMFDAFKAVFPAGTVSGAPKVRAMQIIEEFEPQERGPYAGAVGYFSFNGCCDFAIAIRSIFFEGENGFVQAGAGIVSDSIPENELKETEHKANAMLTALLEATQ